MNDLFQLSNEGDAPASALPDDWQLRAGRLLREAYLTGAERERMERIAAFASGSRADERFVEDIEQRG